MYSGLIPFKDHCFWNTYRFSVLSDIPDVPFDMYRVYPLKQREVYEIYNMTKDLDIIKHVWIFGSSVRYDCNIFSDTDVMLETTIPPYTYTTELNDIMDRIYLSCSVSCDLLRKEHLSDKDFDKLISYGKGVLLF